MANPILNWVGRKMAGAVGTTKRAAAQDMGFDPDRVFYHSTLADIKEFDPAKIKEHGKFGKGFYFSEDPYYAERYPEVFRNRMKAQGKEAPPMNTIPVHLKMENPLVVQTGESNAMVGTAPFKLAGMFPDAKDMDEVTAGIRKMGHDSIVVQDNNGRILESIVFEPNQVRSVNAKFDPKRASSGDITAAQAALGAGGILGALAAPQEAEAGVFPYAWKMAEDALERGSSLFTEKALKSAASDASGNSRTAITMMSPDEFLRVVPTPENSIRQDNIDKIAEHIRSGGKLDDVPFLTVNMDDKMNMPRYTGHEGRHRALALKQLGIEEMPVRIKMGDDMGVRWDQLHSGNPLTRKSLPQQVLHEGTGNTSSAFPIKKTPTGFETARAVAPVATGGILGALGLPEDATAADVIFADKPQVSDSDQKEVQQMILDTLMGFMAPQPLGDATMDAYNKRRAK